MTRDEVLGYIQVYYIDYSYRASSLIQYEEAYWKALQYESPLINSLSAEMIIVENSSTSVI